MISSGSCRPSKHSAISAIFLLSQLLLRVIPIIAVAAFSSHHRPARMLTRRTPQEVQLEIKDPVDPTALSQARAILDELKAPNSSSSSSCSSSSPPIASSAQSTACSPEALLAIAKRLGDIPAENDSYIVSASRCQEAFESLSDAEKKSLLNIHSRVKVFAEAQRRSVVDMEVEIPGGKAGQTVSPCRGACVFAMFLV